MYGPHSKWGAKVVELLEALRALESTEASFLFGLLRERDFDRIAELDDNAYAEAEAVEAEGDEKPEGWLEQVDKAISQVQELIGEVYSLLLNGPNQDLIQGRLLSREEFYLIRAGGLLIPPGNFPGLTKTIGHDWYDEYDIYRLLHYEDERCRGLIYPEPYRASMHSTGREGPTGGLTTGVKGVDPDEVRKSSLSEEQRLFFQTHFPDDYARFRDT